MIKKNLIDEERRIAQNAFITSKVQSSLSFAADLIIVKILFIILIEAENFLASKSIHC